MERMTGWPGAESDAFRAVEEWSQGPEGIRARLTFERGAADVFGPEPDLDRGGFDESTTLSRAVVEVLGQHPYTDEVDRTMVPLDWLRGEATDDPHRAAYLEEAAATLGRGMLALTEHGWTPERVDALLRVAFGVDAVNHLLRQVVLGRSEDRFSPPDLPELLHGFAELLERTCVVGIREAWGELGRAADALPTVWTVGQIEELDPPRGCAGDTITIRGTSFGPTQPADVIVSFPSYAGLCAPATVASWSDTEIVVTAPAEVGVGCVGFVQKGGAGAGEIVGAAGQVAGTMETCLGPMVSHIAAGIRNSAARLAVVCPDCASAGAYFVGGLPRIQSFLANGAKEATLRPGDLLTLSYNATNAHSITIVARDAAELPAVGPLVSLPYGSGTFAVPATGSWTGRYELTAEGACGTVSAQVTIRMVARTAFVLAGGGTRGAFEVGAVACLQRTFKIAPDLISGSSVGALNAAKLAEGPGGLAALEALWAGLTVDSDMYTPQAWLGTLDQLRARYMEAQAVSIVETLVGGAAQGAAGYLTGRLATLLAGPVIGPLLTGPFALADAIQYGIDAYQLADAVTKAMSAPSLYNPAPLAALVAASVNATQVAASGIRLRITVAQLESGRTRLVTEGAVFLDDGVPVPLSSACLASAAIPVVFPAVPLPGGTYVDGGTLENIPITAAIQAGANEAYVVLPSPVASPPAPSFAGATFHQVGPRSLQMLLDEMQRDELEPFRGYGIPLTVIAPRVVLHDALVVDPGLIAINMAYGHMCAFDELQPDDQQRPQLRKLADEIITKRWAIWDLEHSANGELRLVDDPEYSHPVADSAPLLTARDLKKEVRQHVKERQQAGVGAVPPQPAAWWQQWERHRWQPRTPSPWDKFVDALGNSAPEETPPGP